MSELGFCQCGCGQRTRIAERSKNDRVQRKGEPLRYVRGHNGNRGRTMGKQAFGVQEGRASVELRGGGHYLWSRILVWNYIGRELRPDEIVHHINGDKTDDRLDNLAVVTRARHMELHRGELNLAKRKEAA